MKYEFHQKPKQRTKEKNRFSDVRNNIESHDVFISEMKVIHESMYTLVVVVTFMSLMFASVIKIRELPTIMAWGRGLKCSVMVKVSQPPSKTQKIVEAHP